MKKIKGKVFLCERNFRSHSSSLRSRKASVLRVWERWNNFLQRFQLRNPGIFLRIFIGENEECYVQHSAQSENELKSNSREWKVHFLHHWPELLSRLNRRVATKSFPGVWARRGGKIINSKFSNFSEAKAYKSRWRSVGLFTASCKTSGEMQNVRKLSSEIFVQLIIIIVISRRESFFLFFRSCHSLIRLIIINAELPYHHAWADKERMSGQLAENNQVVADYKERRDIHYSCMRVRSEFMLSHFTISTQMHIFTYHTARFHLQIFASSQSSYPLSLDSLELPFIIFHLWCRQWWSHKIFSARKEIIFILKNISYPSNLCHRQSKRACHTHTSRASFTYEFGVIRI